jgi:hypothetical protein
VGMARKHIGILTGGGDVPGLNAVIKSVTYRGSENDIEVVGLRRGWEALTHLNLEDPTSRSHNLIPLHRENTRIIDRIGYLKQSGGPLLHQMLKINHLLTLRSPNANDWRELDHHVSPCDATEVDAFFG